MIATLGGAVAEAIAAAWGTSAKVLVPKDFPYREKDLHVGQDGEREIMGGGVHIVRPS